jgi:hypothetical protein
MKYYNCSFAVNCTRFIFTRKGTYEYSKDSIENLNEVIINTMLLSGVNLKLKQSGFYFFYLSERIKTLTTMTFLAY